MAHGSDFQSVSEEPPYMEVMQELHKLKQDLSRLKLAMTFSIKSKVIAEREFEASSSKIQQCARAAQQLREEIMGANEEHLLVNLARARSEKGIQQVTAQRQKESAMFDKSIKTAKGKIKSIRGEIDRSRDLESKLKITRSELSVLQNYLLEETDQSKVENYLLEAAEAELIAANKELVSAKEEGFQLMTSMDSTRFELIRIAENNKHLKKLEGKSESRIQNLNSKVSKYKSKLDEATVAEERTASIVSNLESALQHLRAETEDANKDEREFYQEIENGVAEIVISQSQFSVTERRLRDAAKELESAKGSEDLALRKLKKAIEKRTKEVRTKLRSSSDGSIAISRTEFEYLSQRGAEAEAVAEKKSAAARAWIEALDAGEKEMTMKSNLMEKRTRESRDKKVALADEMEIESKAKNSRGEENNATRPRKSSGIAVRHIKIEMTRTSGSSLTRLSTSSTAVKKKKKKKKAFPALVRFLSKRRNEEH